METLFFSGLLLLRSLGRGGVGEFESADLRTRTESFPNRWDLRLCPLWEPGQKWGKKRERGSQD